MKQIIDKLQNLVQLLIILSFILGGVRFCMARFTLEQEASGDEFTPEQGAMVLAKRDGRTDYQPYLNVLNELSKKCTENHVQLVGMVASIGKEEKSQGFTEDYFDILNSFSIMADSFERQPGSCLEIHQQMVSGHLDE